MTAELTLSRLANEHVAAAIVREADAWADAMGLADDPQVRLLAFLDHEASCEFRDLASCQRCGGSGRVAVAAGVDRMSPAADDRPCPQCWGA